MLTSHPQKRYRCRFCGLELSAWLPVAKRSEASMRRDHLGQHHLQAIASQLNAERVPTLSGPRPLAGGDHRQAVAGSRGSITGLPLATFSEA